MEVLRKQLWRKPLAPGARLRRRFEIRTLTGHAVTDGLLYYVTYQFCDYWTHRLNHTRLFWPLHRIHHSATSLSPLVAYRFHPMERAIVSFLTILPALMLGLSIRDCHHASSPVRSG